MDTPPLGSNAKEGGEQAEEEDLLKLRPKDLKERLRLAGIEVPLGVTEKAELVALLAAGRGGYDVEK